MSIATNENDGLIDSESKNKKRLLSNNFVPGDSDVIVGRGKKVYDHIGNQLLRRIVKCKLDDYSACTCKFDKSYIISSILSDIRRNGGFVKQDPGTLQWYDIGDLLAREKISQTFRDALHGTYKSSTVVKRKRRQERRAKAVSSSSSDFEKSKHSQLIDLAKFQSRQLALLKQSLSARHLALSNDVKDEPIFTPNTIGNTFKDDDFEPIPISQAFVKEVPPFNTQLVDEKQQDYFEPIQPFVNCNPKHITHERPAGKGHALDSIEVSEGKGGLEQFSDE